MLNLVVLAGQLARPAQHRTLPSGSSLVTMEVTIRRAGEPAETVPVAWFDAPAWASALDTDTPVLAVGRVRRRFFRAGGTTQSRTEVVADRVLRASPARGPRAALAAASATLEAAAAALGR